LGTILRLGRYLFEIKEFEEKALLTLREELVHDPPSF
jgi:hypothetical protein